MCDFKIERWDGENFVEVTDYILWVQCQEIGERLRYIYKSIPDVMSPKDFVVVTYYHGDSLAAKLYLYWPQEHLGPHPWSV